MTRGVRISIYLNYIWCVLRHKYYVIKYCIKLGVPLLGIVHDLSKFRLSEIVAYANYFCGNEEQKEKYKQKFTYSRLYHIHRNPHHWQYWLSKEDEGNTNTLDMPEKYVKEMVADWCGAGIARTGELEVDTWYEKKWHRIDLSNKTSLLVDRLIKEIKD